MTNAAGYRLRISRNPYFSSTIVDKPVNTADVTVTGLAPGAYYWMVQSLDANGKESVESEKNRFTIIPKGKDGGGHRPGTRPLIQHGHVIEVTGKTETGARVMVNGREVPIVTNDGSFHYFTPAFAGRREQYHGDGAECQGRSEYQAGESRNSVECCQAEGFNRGARPFVSGREWEYPIE